MHWIKALLIFLFFGTQKAWSICTEEQSGKMTSCTLRFIESLCIQEMENQNPIDTIMALMDSATEVDYLCEKYRISKQCMGQEAIKNCKELTTDLQSMGDYMEFVFKFLIIGGQFICGDEYYSDPLHAKFEDFDDTQISYMTGFLEKTCNRLEQYAAIILLGIAKKGTSEQKKLIVNLNIIPMLCKMLNEDYSKDDDDRRIYLSTIYYLGTDDKVIEQFVLNNGEEIIKAFINGKDEGIKPVANLLLEDIEKYYEKKDHESKETKIFFKSIGNPDEGVQLSTLKKYREQLEQEKISANAGVERGIIPILGKFLSSKNAEIQAESASILKFCVENHLNSMVEEDMIPALIRTLVSTDAKVLEHSIETLAVIIEQQPKLRNIFMEFNIVEPLLMSYSDDVSFDVTTYNIGIILAHLCKEKIAKKHVVLMVPILSELIYTYDSNTLIQIIPALLIHDAEGLLNEDFIKLAISFLENDIEEIRLSACLIIDYAAKDKDRLRDALNNGALQIMNEKLWTHSGAKLSILSFIIKFAQNANHEQLDELFSTNLISIPFEVANKYDLAASFFYVLILKGNSKHHDALLEMGVVPALLKNLKMTNETIVQNIDINALLLFFEKTKDTRILKQISENDGLEVLGKLEPRDNYAQKINLLKLVNKIVMNRHEL